MRVSLYLIAVFLSFSTTAEQTLNFGYGDYQSPPYVVMDEGVDMPRGIMVDIGRTLTTLLPYKLQLVNVPRKRLESYLEEGQIDMRCHMSPDWVDDAQHFIWSAQLYSLDTVVLTSKQTERTINNYGDMEGLVFAIVRGYNYSDGFNEMVKQGNVRILETHSLESAIAMLGKNRADAVIANNVLSQYLIAQRGLEEKVLTQPFVLRSQSIHCAISRHAKIDYKLIQNGLEEMKRKGAFEVIIKRYFQPVTLAGNIQSF